MCECENWHKHGYCKCFDKNAPHKCCYVPKPKEYVDPFYHKLHGEKYCPSCSPLPAEVESMIRNICHDHYTQYLEPELRSLAHLARKAR